MEYVKNQSNLSLEELLQRSKKAEEYYKNECENIITDGYKHHGKIDRGTYLDNMNSQTINKIEAIKSILKENPHIQYNKIASTLRMIYHLLFYARQFARVTKSAEIELPVRLPAQD